MSSFWFLTLFIFFAISDSINCIEVQKDDVWGERDGKDVSEGGLKLVSVSPQMARPPALKLYNEKGEELETYHFKNAETVKTEDYDEDQGLQGKVNEAKKTAQGVAHPSLEESEYYQDPLVDPSNMYDNGRYKYGSGNFRRARRYLKPRFLVKASVKEMERNKTRRLSWLRIPPLDFCSQSILIHHECDSFLEDPRRTEHRWSFNLEDANCYLYADPCPIFKRNSFRSLSQCIASCWRPSNLKKRRR
jgi:hypothetical protein